LVLGLLASLDVFKLLDWLHVMEME